jgi:hypothetical protein
MIELRGSARFGNWRIVALDPLARRAICRCAHCSTSIQASLEALERGDVRGCDRHALGQRPPVTPARKKVIRWAPSWLSTFSPAPEERREACSRRVSM